MATNAVVAIVTASTAMNVPPPPPRRARTTRVRPRAGLPLRSP